MPLVNSLDMLVRSKKEGKAVGAFNVFSLEMIKGVVQAAEDTKTPLILQLSAKGLQWADFNLLVPAALSAAKHAKIDISVHLDHSRSLDLIKKSLDVGFPSIMYDGSHFGYRRNVNESKKVIEMCKNKATVEIEIGKVGGKENDLPSNSNDIVDADTIIKFYEETKPDILAIAFGTVHGVYKGPIFLNYDLIKEVSSRINVPLVMHGTSGLPFDMIEKSIKSGITKVNVGTDLLIAYNKSIRKFLNENPAIYDIRKINTLGIEAITNKVKEYLKLFNK